MGNHIDLHTHLHRLFEKKSLIFIITFFIFSLTMMYAFTRSTQYQASVLLQVHHNQESSLGSIYQSDNNNRSEPVSSQIALIRSKFILDPVIKTLDLDKKISSNKKIIQLPEWEVINNIRSHLMIIDLTGQADSSADKPSILQLSIVGNDSEKVVHLVNTIAKIAQLKDKERKSFEAKNKLNFLYKQVAGVRSSLNDAETKLKQYLISNNKMNSKEQLQYLFTQLADVKRQLETTRLKRIDLLQQYTSQHPYITALNFKYQELLKQHNQLIQQIKKLNAPDSALQNLLREVNINKNLYMLLLNKIQEQQVVTAGIVSDIGILTLANSPDYSLSPKFSLIAMASLLISFILACFGVLVWQIYRYSFKNENVSSREKFSLSVSFPRRRESIF